ncbi:hypothetical protein CYMTET_33133 [Cymbomonas tetramitiformis]|uniref:Uncharacterized protein n=1 Tax=Cymbomonas tetramitiformis TaxID=36881 RepID=A0AAE0KR87_9CHLO|nr:hypothetical protein CYMTET_33133 [Cymbomonas tetramitiformis]
MLAHNPCSNQGWENLNREWERDSQSKRAKHEPEQEILAGQPNNEQKFWRNVEHLQVHTKETNPDQDTWGNPGTMDKQLYTEGTTTYCYEADGRLIGTLSTAKPRELYDKYVQAVGDTTAQAPTGDQLARRLKLNLEHKIQASGLL